MASKSNNNVDEPGAFPAREWLRNLVVGKLVSFETRKQGASAGDRVYGILTVNGSNVAVESVRQGLAIPKAVGDGADKVPDAQEGDEYPGLLISAYEEAKKGKRGLHSGSPSLVRKLKAAGDGFEALALVEKAQKMGTQGKIKVVVEYVFDGSRFRCLVTDPVMGDLQYGTFTLLLGGVASPRLGNSKSNPPTEPEDFSEEARYFSTVRMLHREVEVSLHGTDKSGTCAVGSIHHPRGNIAVELLKNGFARMSDWSVRLLPPADVPALRFAENNAKRTNTGVWHVYTPPKLAGASQMIGTIIDIVSGDTVMFLPNGKVYDAEDKLIKLSLASIRAPRAGNERTGREGEPYAAECKERLRSLTIGKACKVDVHYEREIPYGEKTERRQFVTIATKAKPDVGEVLVNEGLATTQRHRDDDEKSPRYDVLLAGEAVAKASKKGMHSDKEYKENKSNDLTQAQKAKAYAGALTRAGNLKAIVEYCFNGARYKLYVPSENCHIMFAPSYLRAPQPSPPSGSKNGKTAEPFGDMSRCHARSNILQREVEINCDTVIPSGIILGSISVDGRDYSVDLLGAGLANLDQRKLDYGEVPQHLIDVQDAAKRGKVGLWSIAREPEPASAVSAAAPVKEETISIKIAEIRSGSHYFYHLVNDDAAKVMDDSMKLFTENNGVDGAPCDVKVGKGVAALFDDGTGKRWYRAKILEKEGTAKASVLFVDYGNIASVPVATHLRPLDASLETDKIPPVAKEAVLALTTTRPLSTDEGIEAARMFQSLCWGKELTVRVLGADDSGAAATAIVDEDSEEKTVNEKLVGAGLARAAKKYVAESMARRSSNSKGLLSLASSLNAAEESARKSHLGMWRYGDIGDEDPDEI